tara:strand:- start:660 stop:1385 length:726 start_codon:yes stop_codon:yes gene_type:complete
MAKLRTAFITGVSKGIGLALAKKFSSNGYFIIGSSRSKFNINKAIDSDKSMHLILDVNDRDKITESIKMIKAKNISIDCLINNAGITSDQIFLRMSNDDWDNVIGTNLTGVFNITKHISKIMVKEKFGRIINISSVSGLMGNPGQVNYSSSKAALNGFTKSLAKELATRNITVNTICPGFIDTDMTQILTEEQKTEALNKIPLGRFGSDEEIANLALFLASDNSSYITGQIINVDGGMYMN